jgi:hypothetical protein
MLVQKTRDSVTQPQMRYSQRSDWKKQMPRETTKRMDEDSSLHDMRDNRVNIHIARIPRVKFEVSTWARCQERTSAGTDSRSILGWRRRTMNQPDRLGNRVESSKKNQSPGPSRTDASHAGVKTARNGIVALVASEELGRRTFDERARPGSSQILGLFVSNLPKYTRDSSF